MPKQGTVIEAPSFGGSKPLKRFSVNEKDNGWEVCIDCGVFHKEYVFSTVAKAAKSLVEFMRTPVVDPYMQGPAKAAKITVKDEPEMEDDPETAEDQPNDLDELIEEGDQPTPLANKTIRVGGLAEGRTIVDEEEDE